LTDKNATALPTLPEEDDLLTRVRAAWADVLAAENVTDVPLDANFLETAGSSLLLIMLWEQLHPMTDRTLRVSDLFQHSTVRSQAALLAGEHDRDRTAPAAVGGGPDRSRLLGLARRGPVDGSRS
jgi:hypothetical protein